MCELESMSPVDDAWRIPDSLWERILPLLPPNGLIPREVADISQRASVWTESSM